MTNREPLSLDIPVYDWPHAQKQTWLVNRLNQLTLHHRAYCEPYQRLLSVLNTPELSHQREDFYPLAVRLFKEKALKSIADEEQFRVLTSSGTTSQQVSRIILDKTTAGYQSKALVRIMQEWLGRERRPMLIIDHPGVIQDRTQFSARGAGIQGMLIFGRQPVYALNEDLTPNWEVIDAFFARWQQAPVLMFGFTFMVWQLIEKLHKAGKALPDNGGVLIHSGGWKKLQDQAVDNPTFKTAARQHLGVGNIHNFYGMVEQVGSVFVECEHGHLHTPVFADVIIRDALTGQALPAGATGVIEVLSALPESYPGHVLLTEDRGRWLGEDDCPCGRQGRYFEVAGRVPRAEVRGCSDTVATPSAPSPVAEAAV
ncbi:acyl-protein synthetase [Pokkaliibacter sp. CJK22405]|uniref:LuxE/PaaK family acyltransferase n=1 Tax=Pokkaliibacter sp. CJK22405 TaxID=3384615 RepID=UPI003985184E